MVSGFEISRTYEVWLAAVGYSATHSGTLKVTNVATRLDDLEATFDAPCCFATREMVYSSFEFVASNTELELVIFNPAGFATNVDDISIIYYTRDFAFIDGVVDLDEPFNHPMSLDTSVWKTYGNIGQVQDAAPLDNGDYVVSSIGQYSGLCTSDTYDFHDLGFESPMAMLFYEPAALPCGG